MGNEREDRKQFANYKFAHGCSFEGKDLVHADFRGAALVHCNFKGADLSYANLEGANCYGADFTDAKLYKTNFRDATLAKTIMHPRDAFGITLTMTCDTFEGMDVSNKWNVQWFFLTLMMKQEEAIEKAVI